MSRDSDLREWQRICLAMHRYEMADADEVEDDEYEQLFARYHELKDLHSFTPLDYPEEYAKE